MSSSPRSSALSRSSLQRSRRSVGVSSLTRQLDENIMMILVLAAVVVAAAIAWIVGERYHQRAVSLGWDELFQNGVLAGVALLLVLLVTAWITAQCYMRAHGMERWALLGIFVVIAVLLGVAAWYFWRRQDRNVAFYLVVAATVLGLVHTFLCFRAYQFMGVAGMVPAVLLLAFLLWRFWPEDEPAASAHRA